MANAIGAGASSFGVGAFGVGTPAITESPEGQTLTGPGGLQYGSRLIGYDPDNRGQYVFDSNGMAVGESNARQLVFLAVETLLDSSVVSGLGRGPMPRKIGPNFVQEVTAQIENALADLVKRQIIRLDSVQVFETTGGRSFTRVEIFDLTTQLPIRMDL